MCALHITFQYETPPQDYISDDVILGKIDLNEAAKLCGHKRHTSDSPILHNGDTGLAKNKSKNLNSDGANLTFKTMRTDLGLVRMG